jgi:hypothetical protein
MVTVIILVLHRPEEDDEKKIYKCQQTRSGKKYSPFGK